jgi:hypothetical protein
MLFQKPPLEIIDIKKSKNTQQGLEADVCF